MSSVLRAVWKNPVVIGALVVGCMAASQAGWSGAEFIAYRGEAGFATDLLFSVTVAISYGTVLLVRRIAKPMLWALSHHLCHTIGNRCPVMPSLARCDCIRITGKALD